MNLVGSEKNKINDNKNHWKKRQNLPSFSIPRKPKEKLNIRFKFNDSISEERGDETLFRVFDILLSPQKREKGLIKVKKNNENNRSPNNPNKA